MSHRNVNFKIQVVIQCDDCQVSGETVAIPRYDTTFCDGECKCVIGSERILLAESDITPPKGWTRHIFSDGFLCPKCS